MHRIFKVVITVFTLLVLSNCVSSKSNFELEAKIIAVYSQKYSGGQKGTPSGIKYKLLVIAPASQNEFKTVGFWIENKYATALAYRNKIGVNKALYNKGDTITVAANFTLTPNGYDFKDESLKEIKPTGFNQKILLSYIIKDKKKYTGFNEIQELEQELRP